MNTITEYKLSDKEVESLRDTFEDDGSLSIPYPNDQYDGCIILIGDGHIFTHQTGGFACLHPRERGTVWFGAEKSLKEIEDLIYERYGGYCVPNNHFFVENDVPMEDRPNPSASCPTSADADAIDFIFENHGHTNLKVDRAKLQQSMEAWIYGLMNGKPCVFVMANSD